VWFLRISIAGLNSDFVSPGSLNKRVVIATNDLPLTALVMTLHTLLELRFNVFKNEAQLPSRKRCIFMQLISIAEISRLQQLPSNLALFMSITECHRKTLEPYCQVLAILSSTLTKEEPRRIHGFVDMLLLTSASYR
jgi:hypothetical protein